MDPMSNVHHLFPPLDDVRVPEELRELPAWVTWKREVHPGETRPRKVPYWADGNRRYGTQGGSLDRSCLVTFEAARDAAIARGHDGVGFAPLAEFGYTFLDFDKCVDADGGLPDDVMAIVGRTYCEYSPSGTGVRAVLKGDLGNGKSHATEGAYGAEFFSTKGFVTFTGHILPVCSLIGYEDHVAPVDENTRQFAEARFGRSDRPAVDPDNFLAGREPPIGLTVSEMQNLLSHLDPSMGREPWLRVGMALHHETQGDDTGLDLWDSWSSEGAQYQGTDDLRYQWERFEQRPGRRSVTMATVKWMAKEAGYKERDDGWRAPHPLPDESLPVPPMTEDMLPPALRAYLTDIADRMSLPLDFVGIPAMVMLGSLVGRKLSVRPEEHTDWYETANIWGAIVAPPGAMKSPAVAQVFAPIKQLEEQARRQNQKAEERHKLALMVHEAGKKNALQNAKGSADAALEAVLGAYASEPPKPKLKRFMISDATVEKLGVICADNPDGVLYHRDELPTLLAELEREEKTALRGFMMTGWSGRDGYTFDRIERGTVDIEAVNISLFGTAQPHRLAKLVANAEQKLNDGLMQRLQLLASPELPPDWVPADRPPDAAAREAAFACCQRLAELSPDALGAERDDFGGVPFLRLSSEARAMFVAYRTELEKKVRSGKLPELLVGHLSKYRGLVPRIALILHLADAGRGEVTAAAMETAIKWARYLEGHARLIYASSQAIARRTAHLILVRLGDGDLQGPFTRREILQRGWSGLQDLDEVTRALEVLEKHGWLRLEKTKTGGRPKEIYSVNPLASLPAA
jgi:hypothetical protein